MDFFYDGQLRKYLIQMIRVFSHFEVRELSSTGERFVRVPCRYADASRLVQHILNKNSENAILNAPQIAVTLANLQLAPNRRQDPRLVDTRQVAEREWDEDSQSYGSGQGNLYTLQRYMPVPYNMTIDISILTTNTDTKLQLLEQIMVLFNPSLQLQSNDNPLDWSNVFEVELTNIQWSNRTVPSGPDEILDISTMTFEVPIWISPPAKVTQQKIIQKIITDIHDVSNFDTLDFNDRYYDFFAQVPEEARAVFTPNDYYVLVEDGYATLISKAGYPTVWQDLIEMKGEITQDSLLELSLTPDLDDKSNVIIGSVAYDTADESRLLFTVDTDTLPSDTLAAVDRIIDPYTQGPDEGLPTAAVGQRYMIVDAVSVDHPVWAVNAVAGSILEYDGTSWFVSFDGNSTEDYFTNTFTGEQFRWAGQEWVSSWQGQYNPLYWRLIL